MNFKKINFAKLVVFPSIGLAMSAAIISCSNRPDPNLPFDKDGNYIENWDKDGSFAFQEPEAPSFYEESTKPQSSSPAKPRPKRSTSTASTSKRTHTVKKGDTLWRISQKYGTTVGKIQQANGISGTKIFPDQKLIIP